MCPRYTLSDNGTEFKNQLMDKVLQQLGIECIFSAPYHPQSNGKLEVIHKYLKLTLKKLCEKDPTQLRRQVYKSSSSQLQIDIKPYHWRNSILLSLWERPYLPLHQLLEPMQRFLGDPESGLLNLEIILETHHLALAIAKKTLDKNCFRTAQKTTNREAP